MDGYIIIHLCVCVCYITFDPWTSRKDQKNLEHGQIYLNVDVIPKRRRERDHLTTTTIDALRNHELRAAVGGESKGDDPAGAGGAWGQHTSIDENWSSFSF